MTGYSEEGSTLMPRHEANERVKVAFQEILSSVFDKPKNIEEWYARHGGDPRQLRAWRSGTIIIDKENWETKFENWLLEDFGSNTLLQDMLAKSKPAIDAERDKSKEAQRRGKANATASEPFQYSARDVFFWHCFQDRERDKRGVRDLIAKARKRVVVTGGSLDQCVWRFRNEIRAALERKVLVSLMMADLSSEDALRQYVRYADSLLKLACLTENRYKDFCKSLSSSQRQGFSFSYTKLPLTHSLGLYDDQIYVSEFCIDRHAEECPSYFVPRGSHSYGVFFYEIYTILKESGCLLGRGKEKIIAQLTSEIPEVLDFRP